MSTIPFDIHLFGGSSLFDRAYSAEQVEALSNSDKPYQGLVIPAKPMDYHFGESFDKLEKSLSKNWVLAHRVDPWRISEALDSLDQRTSPVLFLHPFEEQFYPTHNNVEKLIEKAEQKSLIVMIATGYLPFSHSAQVLPLIQNFPQVPFIITHGGQINICGLHLHEAFEIFTCCENTYFETSGIYRQDYIEQAIKELGIQRVLYGSGGPVYDPRYEIQRIKHLSLNSDDSALILGDNARGLLKRTTAESR